MRSSLAVPTMFWYKKPFVVSPGAMITPKGQNFGQHCSVGDTLPLGSPPLETLSPLPLEL